MTQHVLKNILHFSKVGMTSTQYIGYNQDRNDVISLVKFQIELSQLKENRLYVIVI